MLLTGTSLRLTIGLALTFFALQAHAANTAAPERFIEDAQTAKLNGLVAQYQRTNKEDEVISLNASDGPFVGFSHKQNTPNLLGGVIIVHTEGENLDQPNTVQELRHYLSDYGWHTLSIALPNIPELIDGAANTKQSLADATASAEKAKAKYESWMMERIQASVDWLTEQGVEKWVLIGHGTGSTWVANYLEATNATLANEALTPNAPAELPSWYMVLMSPHAPINHTQTHTLVSSIENIDIPSLDLYEATSPANRGFAKRRHDAAKRSATRIYEQVAMPSVTLPKTSAINPMVKKVRGWLAKQMNQYQRPRTKLAHLNSTAR